MLVSRPWRRVGGAAGPWPGVGHRHQGGASEWEGERASLAGVLGEGGAVLGCLCSELGHGGKFVGVGVVGVDGGSSDGNAEQGLDGSRDLVGGCVAVQPDQPELVSAVAGVAEPAGEEAPVVSVCRGGALHGGPHRGGGGMVNPYLEGGVSNKAETLSSLRL